MAEVIRVLLADSDPRFRAELGEFLNGRNGLRFLGALERGEDVARAVAETKPSVLLICLDSRPTGGLKVLQEVRRHWRGDELPVIALAPPERGEVLLQEAASLGADYCMQRPVDYAVLARRIKQLCRENVPRFAADLSRQRVEDICRRYFDAMGIPPHYKGYRYLMEGVWLACQHPRWLNAVTTRLYPAIGKRFATGGVQVERAMRYALDATWEKGELDELYRLFPYEVRPDSGKPTNSAFLAKMVNFVLLEIDVGG